MPVRFRCPNPACDKLVSMSRTMIGQTIPCPFCSRFVKVPQLQTQGGPPPGDAKIAVPIGLPSPTAGAQPRRPTNAAGVSSNISALRQIFLFGLVASGIAGLLTITSFAVGLWILGILFLLVTLVLIVMLLKGLFEVTTATARAIERGEREVDIFFKCVKLVLWEQNEGLLFLRNKQIHEVVYGPEQGGGTRFIFPIFGDEIKVHVPLTLQMSQFEDEKVLTRESIQLRVKVALWWRIKDRKGLEDFYLLIDKEIHLAGNVDMRTKGIDYSGEDKLGVQRGPKRAELNAAERWMLTLVESCLRKLVAQTSVAWVISKRATDYLHVKEEHGGPGSPGHQEDSQSTPDLIGKSLQGMLASELEEFGLVIQKAEIQEVRLPEALQESIDRVWEATLLPARTAQEALARSNLIKVELEAVKEVIGQEATAKGHLLGKMQDMTFYTGVEQTLEQLLSVMTTTQNAPPPSGNGQSSQALPSAAPADVALNPVAMAGAVSPATVNGNPIPVAIGNAPSTGAVSLPPPASAQTAPPGAEPNSPVSAPTPVAKPNRAEGCPKCGRKASGNAGTRYCVACDVEF
jgi:regulator of protease activity HflC (stomatin/prohibitin superfamily)